jgi:serine/threonine protein kinase
MLIGSTIVHYRIVRKLGEGGMGVVYGAVDTRTDQPVALKLLAPSLAGDERARQRLLREARVMAALDHPNICRVLAAHDVDGQLIIVMAQLSGETLARRIARGVLPFAEAMGIAAQVASGLAAAHEKGIVHRDIKPSNVMLGEDDVARIMDFGLARTEPEARAVQTGALVGTIAYMSPEQASGGDVDHRTDLWSLGCVLFEMLVGQPPFGRGRRQGVLAAIVEQEAPVASEARPEVPAAVDGVIAACLRKRPEERPATARQLVALIEEARAASRARSAGRRQDGRRRARRSTTRAKKR